MQRRTHCFIFHKDFDKLISLQILIWKLSIEFQFEIIKQYFHMEK